jgi:hypothetical protein
MTLATRVAFRATILQAGKKRIATSVEKLRAGRT